MLAKLEKERYNRGARRNGLKTREKGWKKSWENELELLLQ